MKRPLEGVAADSLLHRRLLYQYRNSLLHEFRQPGHGSDLADTEEPHYITLGSVQRPTNPELWLLNYPREFFERLVDDGLSNLRRYLTENDLNPYESYVFGDYWYESLNR